ncbi:MAG: hypothetical protein WEB05_07100, partial [Solirubrobacterales bacterium]
MSSPAIVALGLIVAAGNIDAASGSGEVSFTPSTGTPPSVLAPFPVGDAPLAVEAGQLNSDDSVDFVTASSTSANVSVGLGSGGGSLLSNPITWGAPAGASGVAIGDFDE